mmetsp:Transcript_15264/g.62328  ORF Transcript_15264/g.62328 Transcript_15264/m.62328 type:complete len:220 (+) Transcript_15264:976-1635(+)
MGSIPRSMTVHMTAELTRACKAGDNVVLTGIFLPVPYTGYRALRAGLLSDTYVKRSSHWVRLQWLKWVYCVSTVLCRYLEAMHIEKLKKDYDEQVNSPEVQEQLVRITEDPNLYGRMAESIAPEIFGMEDVKRALLLLLVGAPERTLPDGMKLRGDIHICLMVGKIVEESISASVSLLTPRLDECRETLVLPSRSCSSTYLEYHHEECIRQEKDRLESD